MRKGEAQSEGGADRNNIVMKPSHRRYNGELARTGNR
jgi:hypothetical protein